MKWIVFFALLISGELYAAEHVAIGSVPSWLYQAVHKPAGKPASSNISNGYFYELYEHQVNLVLNTDYQHYIRNIVNESGVQAASEVSVSCSPEYQHVIFHSITVIRNGVSVNQLALNKIRLVQEETEASNYQYNGMKRAFLILKDIQKNDRIDIAYSITGFNPVFQNRYSQAFYFYQSTAIQDYFETIIAPSSRKLFLKAFNNAPMPQVDSSGQNRIYCWNNPPMKKWVSQPKVPS